MVSKQIVFKQKLLPYLLILPEAVIILVFFFWPASQAVLQSFFREDPWGLSKQFVGIANYLTLFSDEGYLKVILTTLYLSSVVTVFSLLGGLVFAWLVFSLPKKHGSMYQTLVIWPYAVAPATAGVVWLFLFNPRVGIAALVLEYFNVDWNYVLNGSQALLLVSLAASWKRISYNFLFFLAGFMSIPRSLVESAVVDGAGRLMVFRKVILPLLNPVITFLLTMNLLYSVFDTFGTIHQLTQGGPNHATETLVYKVFSDGFLGLDLGGSSAQSVVIMTAVIIITVIQFKFTQRKVV
ncbi:MAG: ABC transporter permease subunit [Spirochaetales bacterium]|nr:ABC transporter permease subunit [Spirochaetales bacterium]